MNINQIRTDNKAYYHYETDEFVTIKIRHYFNYENTKENCIKAMILSKYLLKTNKIYKTQKEIKDRSLELYGSYVDVNYKFFGSKTMLIFDLSMVNQRKIEEDYFLDSLNFYKDIMLKPNFKNNKLEKSVYKEIKKELISKFSNELKDPNIIHERLFYQKVIPQSDINNHNFSDANEFKEIINKIKSIDIINFYKETINNYIMSFSFGNLLNEEIELIKNSFDFKQIDFDFKYDVKEIINNTDIEIKSSDTTQSYIYFVYEIKDFNKNKTYMYDTLSTLLNSHGPIFDIYRNKLGIVYAAGAKVLSTAGLLYIKADIDKKNKDKAVYGLKEIFSFLNNTNEIKKRLKFVKEKRKEILIQNSERISEIIREIENYVLKFDSSSEEKFKLINKITPKEIINQINNLEYKCMYFYIGDKNEK